MLCIYFLENGSFFSLIGINADSVFSGTHTSKIPSLRFLLDVQFAIITGQEIKAARQRSTGG